MRCSVIIPVYNRSGLTRRCVEQLLAAPPQHCAWEIIIVNDGSTDDTAAMLARFGDRVKAITLPQNAGFADACNAGVSAGTGAYVHFLNNDTVPLPGWLDALIDYAQAHPQVGGVGSKLLYPSGTIQHAGGVVMQDRYPRHIYHGFPQDHPAVNKSRRYQVVTGASLLVPRTLFDKLGGFDTAYRNGYEDFDLCLRLGALGYEVHYCHHSVLYHLESVSEGRNRHDDRNTQIFCDRWQERLIPDDVQYYLEDGLLQIHYQGAGRIKFVVSPLLATVQDDSNFVAVAETLDLRAQQVFDLLRENILLRVAAISRADDPTIKHALPQGPTAAAA